jgi:hypothetical protein
MSCTINKQELLDKVAVGEKRVREELVKLRKEEGDSDYLAKMVAYNSALARIRSATSIDVLDELIDDLVDADKLVEISQELAKVREADTKWIPTGEVINGVRYYKNDTQAVKSVVGKELELFNESNKPIKTGTIVGARYTTRQVNGQNVPAVAIRIDVDGKQSSYVFASGMGGASITSGGYTVYADPALVDRAIDVVVEEKNARQVARLKGTSGRDYVLGSQESNGDIAGELVQNYTHGDVASMTNMVNKLQEIGAKKAGDKEFSRLRSLISAMNPSFFYKTRLMIDRAAASRGEFSVKASGEHTIGLKIGVDKGLSMMSTQMSDAAIYVHEVLHSMTAFALRSDRREAQELKRELRYAYDVAKKNTTWQDMLGKPVEEATPTEIDAAKKVYSYTFENQSIVDDEFLAQALTYEPLVNHLSTLQIQKGEGKRESILQKVMGLFFDVMDVVLGNFKFNERNNTVLEQVVNLTYKLGEINNEAEQKVKDRENFLERAAEYINEVDRKASDALKGVLKKVADPDDKYKPISKDASWGKLLVGNMKIVGKSIVNPTYRAAFGQFLSSYGLKPESTIREFFRDMFEASDINQTAQWLGLASDKIDRLRQTRIDSIKMNLMDGFTKEPTELEQVALTDVVIDTNLTSLVGKDYSWQEVVGLIKGGLSKELDSAIKDLRSYSSNNANWLENQAVGLGYYMATHQASIAQNLSARNISAYTLLTTGQQADPVLEKLVNKVAVLTALKHTKQVSKDTLVDLVGREEAGLNGLVEVYESFKAESKELMFKDTPMHMIDGYSKEIFDEGVVLQVAPLKDAEAMKKMGLSLVRPLSRKKGDSTSQALGLYVSEVDNTVERQKGAVRTNVSTTKGTTLRSLKYLTEDNKELAGALAKRDLVAIELERVRLTKAMANGRLSLDDLDMGMTAVLDSQGNVTDYRYMMSKDGKEELLKQNRQVTDVLARSYGQLVDKVETKDHNNTVADVLIEYMEENWTKGDWGKDTTQEFARIGPNSKEEKLRELYYQLPEKLKNYVDSRPDQTLAVPREVLNLMFGYKHMSLANIAPDMVKQIVRMVESFWVDVVKVYRGNIVLKMPIILIQNLFSNIQYAIVTLNLNPLEVIREYKESFQSIKEYLKINREAEELKIEVRKLQVRVNRGSTEAKSELASKSKELERKLKLLESNPIYADIINTGIHQSIQEDVNAGYVHDTNKVDKMVSKFTDKLPSMVKEGLSIIYLDKTTKWYKVNQEFLQISDLIARDVQNRRVKKDEIRQANGETDLPLWWTERQLPHLKRRRELTGKEREEFLQMSEKKRRYDLLQNFINYNKPSGRGEEWANRVGLLLFTKYLKRIQHIIVNSYVEHPLKTLAMLLAGGQVLPGESIMNQSLIARYLDDNPMGLFGTVPVYNPVEVLEGVITPGLFKSDTYKPLL